jgi:ribonucleoside-diphosphate reductase alpha chain
MSPIKKIIKRDGRIADFDQSKIVSAIWKAVQSVGGDDKHTAEQIANQVTAVLEVFFKKETDIPNVEQIQDLVEKILIEGGHAKTAKAYILYRQKRADERIQKELILGKGMGENNLNFSMNALKVLEKRYLLKDENGDLKETPEDMIRRIADSIAEMDKNYNGDVKKTSKEFFDMIANLEFMPNSPTLMNAGTNIGQLSACFVLPVEDSMEGIFDTLKNAALIHKSGGGTGFSFSRLRPSNDTVKSTTGVSSGPVSFMKVFDAATEVIKQGGKRRGANMGILRVDHPDILDFINCKADMKTLTNFNISVAITNKFMEALEKNEEYELLNPRTKQPIKTLPAQMVFDIILANAWKNGDPGLIFIDEANAKHPAKHLGEIEATNPCGEQPLLPYESCNLGSINLNKVIATDRKDLDWKKLDALVEKCVHFLDNVIDANHYPIEKIAENSRRTRKIGLGIMGFADVLFQLGIAYDSEEGIAYGEKVMKAIYDSAIKYSIKLAETRGTFPAWKGSEYEAKGMKIRNACVTSIAPTGTIGMLAEASGGLEPNFAISYIKNVMDGTEFIYTNRFFEEEMKRRGLFNQDLMAEIAKVGTIQHMMDLPEDIRHTFVVAQDIAPEWHVRMQAAFQKYTDSSVSKTINFPATASIEDIKNSYWLAFKLHCKGITIYRDQSREAQVLNIGRVNKKEETVATPLQAPHSHITPPQTLKKPVNKVTLEEVIPPPIISMSRPHKALSKLEILKEKKCPECQSEVQTGEGCLLCLNCGFSACAV